MNRQPSSWLRVRALVWKEAIQIISDPSSILIAFVLPVLLLFLYGYAVSLDSTKIKVGLAIEDRSPDVERQRRPRADHRGQLRVGPGR